MKLWTPNQTLKNGRFIIQKVLGSGGFGVTYSVVEQRTGKLFAIKTLNPMQQSQGDFAERQEQFINEAMRLRGCNHPHVVKVHEVIQEDGLWGMVMECVNGDDLGVYVDKHGQLSESEALRYIDQVGQALEYVHQQGFLHRDIKPNNIILRGGKQEAVLIDFGLAREFTIGKTLSMTNSKTQGYAPIEQYERQGRFGAYTDVYALAATLYSLLTAEVPFPANFRKQGISLPPPKQFNSDISDKVNDAIIKGMALEPRDRPQTMREWLELVMTKKVTNFKTFVGQDFSDHLARITTHLGSIPKLTPQTAEQPSELNFTGCFKSIVFVMLNGAKRNEASQKHTASRDSSLHFVPLIMTNYNYVGLLKHPLRRLLRMRKIPSTHQLFILANLELASNPIHVQIFHQSATFDHQQS